MTGRSLSVCHCAPLCKCPLIRFHLLGNSRLPQFAQENLVDVFMVRADSGEHLLHFVDLPNPTNGLAGFQQVQANDTWWSKDGPNWPGHNVSFPFYFVIVRSDQTFGQGIPQPTFTAVREYH